MFGKQKNTIKLFFIFFLAGYLVFNWNDISWFFNYKAVSGLASAFFNPYQNSNPYQNQILPMPTIPETKNNIIAEKNSDILENIKIEYTEKENILEIPAIQLETRIVFPQTKDVNALYKYLDSGVIYYIDSVKPHQEGLITILGHSAPPGWPKIKYDTVFSNLEKLSAGDQIYLNIKNQKYAYIVTDKKIIEKGQEIKNPLTSKTNMIALVSCYPPGKDQKRIVVFGEIIRK